MHIKLLLVIACLAPLTWISCKKDSKVKKNIKIVRSDTVGPWHDMTVKIEGTDNDNTYTEHYDTYAGCNNANAGCDSGYGCKAIEVEEGKYHVVVTYRISTPSNPLQTQTFDLDITKKSDCGQINL